MIELKEAVEISLNALKSLPLLQDATPVELEEAEMEDNFWVVTFSYPDPNAQNEMPDAGPNLAAVLRNKRAYKSVRLLVSDGTIRGIKSIHE